MASWSKSDEQEMTPALEGTIMVGFGGSAEPWYGPRSSSVRNDTRSRVEDSERKVETAEWKTNE